MIKYLTNTLFALFVIIASYLSVALVCSVIPAKQPEVNCIKNCTLYLADNGVHLDMVIPQTHAAPWIKELSFFEHYKFLAFGWGDRGFYLNTAEWKDLKLSTALNALYWKSKAAMHVTGYHEPAGHWIELNICPHQMKLISDYLLQSFRGSNSLDFKPIAEAGYGNRDLFYEAHGSYSLITTCNQWVNRGLIKAGLPSSIWSPFPFGIKYQLSRYEFQKEDLSSLSD